MRSFILEKENINCKWFKSKELVKISEPYQKDEINVVQMILHNNGHQM
jgi:hypothetical protein